MTWASCWQIRSAALRFTGTSPALEKVVAELVEAKLASGRTRRYAVPPSIPFKQFAKGRESVPVAKIGFKEVEGSEQSGRDYAALLPQALFLGPLLHSGSNGDPISRALKQKDASGLTLRQKFVSLCKFLNGRTPSERQGYLDALENLQTGKHWTIAKSSAEASRYRSGKPRGGGERLLANVCPANGETDAETRRRLLLAFNTPFFP